MAKQYTKNVWVDEVLADTEKYQVKNDAGAIVYNTAEIALATSVVTAGSDVNAARMNNIENGIDAIDTLVSGNAVPVKAVGSELTTGTDDAKYATAKALKDAGVPAVKTTADKDFLVGNGTDWQKKTLAETKIVLGATSIGGVAHKQLWIAGWKPTKTSGCAESAQLEMTTNKNVVDYLAFDASTIEYAYANVPMPDDYSGGAVYAKYYWLHPATTTNFGVVWTLSGVSFADDGTLDAAQGTGVAVVDTGGTTNDLYISGLSTAITIAGTPTAGKYVNFRLYRDAISATYDTLAVDAYLLGVMIWYPVS